MLYIFVISVICDMEGVTWTSWRIKVVLNGKKVYAIKFGTSKLGSTNEIGGFLFSFTV